MEITHGRRTKGQGDVGERGEWHLGTGGVELCVALFRADTPDGGHSSLWCCCTSALWIWSGQSSFHLIHRVMPSGAVWQGAYWGRGAVLSCWVHVSVHDARLSLPVSAPSLSGWCHAGSVWSIGKQRMESLLSCRNQVKGGNIQRNLSDR